MVFGSFTPGQVFQAIEDDQDIVGGLVMILLYLATLRILFLVGIWHIWANMQVVTSAT